MKSAILEQQTSSLQKDIDSINNIIIDFNDLTDQKSVDCVDFLLRAKILNDNIQAVTYKPIRADINVDPYDLPRELKEKRKKLEKYKS